MGLAHSPSIVTNGLVTYLDAANPKSYPGSGTTWTDLSSNRRAASLVSGPTFDSGNGGAIVFDGVNDNVSINSFTTDISNGYTAIMIAKWSNFTGGSFNYVQAPTYINFYNGGSNKLRWETYGSNSMTSNASLTTGQITFVAGSFSGVSVGGNTGTAKIYINGLLDKTATLASGPTITAAFVLGTYEGFFTGSIYCFQFYNKELTASEIQQNFNALRGRYGL